MQRLTLIAAGLIGALSLSATVSAHGWEREGDRQDRFEGRERGHEYAESHARHEAALRNRREVFRPYAAPAPRYQAPVYRSGYAPVRVMAPLPGELLRASVPTAAGGHVPLVAALLLPGLLLTGR